MPKRVQKYKREYYENHKEYYNDFQKKNYKMFCFKLNVKNDNDVIEKLDSVNNKINYVKTLVRKDIEVSKMQNNQEGE